MKLTERTAMTIRHLSNTPNSQCLLEQEENSTGDVLISYCLSQGLLSICPVRRYRKICIGIIWPVHRHWPPPVMAKDYLQMSDEWVKAEKIKPTPTSMKNHWVSWMRRKNNAVINKNQLCSAKWLRGFLTRFITTRKF